uniref:Uncharacterized protein n=1 Tax=Anopheles merus TaxID=30066 RepID=A0A182V5N0_ANOME
MPSRPTPHSATVMPNRALSAGPPFRKTGSSFFAWNVIIFLRNDSGSLSEIITGGSGWPAPVDDLVVSTNSPLLLTTLPWNGVRPSTSSVACPAAPDRPAPLLDRGTFVARWWFSTGENGPLMSSPFGRTRTGHTLNAMYSIGSTNGLFRLVCHSIVSVPWRAAGSLPAAAAASAAASVQTRGALMLFGAAIAVVKLKPSENSPRPACRVSTHIRKV